MFRSFWLRRRWMALTMAAMAFTAAALWRLPAGADSVSPPLVGAPTAQQTSGPSPSTSTSPSASVSMSPGPGFGLTATVLNPDQVRIDWRTDRTDIRGWTVARDGHDDRGTGAWGTELPAGARSHTFNILVAGLEYTFTLTALTATGPGSPARVRANTSSPGPSTLPSPPQSGTGATAAERLGWGVPLPASDEFNYVGAPDGSKWNRIGGCGPGHVGNGRRCDANSRVTGSTMVQSGTAGGDTGWLGSKFNQRYGRWEVRVRSLNTGSNTGHQYHPVLIIWPDREPWPLYGEYDFLENSAPGEACAGAFIHYPHPQGPTQQEHAVERDCGAPLSQWHTVAIDWQPTGITGYLDGVRWYSYSGGGGPNGRSDIQAMPGGHLTIQLDNFTGTSGLTPAQFEIDWVHVYSAS